MKTQFDWAKGLPELPGYHWQGWHLNQPAHEYHDHPALGSGDVKKAGVSPAHLAAKFDTPEWLKPNFDTPALEFGRAFHEALLEPDVFKRNYAISPKHFDDYRLKDAKDFLKGFEADAGGRSVLKYSEGWLIDRMLAACYALPKVKTLLESQGHCEASLYAQNPEHTLALKGRTDKVIPEFGWFMDAKTMAELSPKTLKTALLDYAWHVQAAHYLHVGELVDGPDVWNQMVFLCVEKKPPFTACLAVLDSDTLQIGKQIHKKCLQNAAKFFHEDCTDGSMPEVADLILPEWARVV
jgi:hypothetical protein